MSKKELKALLASAKTPEEHMRLATLRSKSGDMDCEQMMAKPGQMMSEMTAMDAQLEQMVATMNEAAGEGKVDAMDAVINELVSQTQGHARQGSCDAGRHCGPYGWRDQPGAELDERPMMKRMAK